MNIITHKSKQIENILESSKGFCHFDNDQYKAFKREHPELISPSRLKHYAVSPLAGITADAEPQETTDAMRFGSLVHAHLLSPELIDTKFIAEAKEVEKKKDGTPYADGRQSAAQKQRWAELAEQGVQVNSPEEHATAATMAAHLAAAVDADDHGNQQYSAELTFWCSIPDRDLILCGTADAVCFECDYIRDAKTTASADLSDRELIDAFFRYGYNIQAGEYAVLYESVIGRPLRSFVFDFVSKTAPHLAKSLKLDRDQLDRCVFDYLQTLDKFLDAYPLTGAGIMTPQDDLSPVLAPCFRTPYYIPSEA